MKPQVNEQNGSPQNGDIATDAASVAMDAAAIVSAAAAATTAVASAGAVVPAKSSQQLKLEMLNIGNGNGECDGATLSHSKQTQKGLYCTIVSCSQQLICF
ncbi:hypothetical protein ACLKA6_014913 [Drosophila palustris]